jgi:hypothetical protein
MKGVTSSRPSMGVIDATVGRLLPLPWSRIAITVCEKA